MDPFPEHGHLPLQSFMKGSEVRRGGSGLSLGHILHTSLAGLHPKEGWNGAARSHTRRVTPGVRCPPPGQRACQSVCEEVETDVGLFS